MVGCGGQETSFKSPALKAMPAQVLDSAYSYESFGSWSITPAQGDHASCCTRWEGPRRHSAAVENKEAAARMYEPLWRRTVASGEFDAELQSEIIRTLSSL